MRTLAVTQNLTVDGSIEKLGDWFDPQGQADADHCVVEVREGIRRCWSSRFPNGRCKKSAADPTYGRPWPSTGGDDDPGSDRRGRGEGPRGAASPPRRRD